MAKIYSPPKEIGNPPEITHPFDFKAYEKANDEYITKVQAYAKANGQGNLAGETVSFPVADGYAQYVVFSLKPVILLHLAVGDAWQFPYANLLTAAAVREETRRSKAFAAIFAKKG